MNGISEQKALKKGPLLKIAVRQKYIGTEKKSPEP
jgi:hypothetical protein